MFTIQQTTAANRSKKIMTLFSACILCLFMSSTLLYSAPLIHEYDQAYSRLYNYEKSIKKNNGNIIQESSSSASSKLEQTEKSKKKSKPKSAKAKNKVVVEKKVIVRDHGRHHYHHRRPRFFRKRVRPMFSFGSYPKQVIIEKHYMEPKEKETFWQSTLDPLENTPELTDEQLNYINYLIDRYEDNLGTFQFNIGLSADRNGSNGISGTMLDLQFLAPHSYNYSGTSMHGIGFKLNGKEYVEGDVRRTSIKALFEGRTSSLNKDSASSFLGRIGFNANVLSADEGLRSFGPVFGLGYKYFNLENNYSFHANYDATLYNLGSNDYEMVVESHIDSFLRVHFGQFNMDIGGEINITDFEANAYIYQGFIRTGFRI